MGQPIDLSNKRFGKLLAIAMIGSRNKKRVWKCLCDCGKEHEALAAELTRGETNSCGCSKLKHGHSRDATYLCWSQMLQRCKNPLNKNFRHYGARGISVCPEWHDFKRFLLDMGVRQKGLTLDRINNDGNYCKENCRWATRLIQSRNKRTNRLLTWQGATMLISDWEAHLGFSRGVLTKRLRRMPLEQALSMPSRYTPPTKEP